jgi:hypothetical protein
MEKGNIEEIARARMSRLLYKGAWNSILLALTFMMYVAQGYISGNYILVAIGAFACYATISDAVDFYRYRKAVKEFDFSEDEKHGQE